MYRSVVWVARIVLVLTLAIIGYAAMQPVSGAPPFADFDKIVHGGVFAGLYVLAWLALPGPVLRWSIHGGLLIYGVLLELLQAKTGYRYAEAADVLANVTGAGLGNLLLSFAKPKFPQGLLTTGSVERG